MTKSSPNLSNWLFIVLHILQSQCSKITEGLFGLQNLSDRSTIICVLLLTQTLKVSCRHERTNEALRCQRRHERANKRIAKKTNLPFSRPQCKVRRSDSFELSLALVAAAKRLVPPRGRTIVSTKRLLYSSSLPSRRNVRDEVVLEQIFGAVGVVLRLVKLHSHRSRDARLSNAAS